MDYIYIDTSIFEANNFLEGKRINEILKLSEEGYVSILLPAITYNEIKNRGIKNIKEASLSFKKYRDSTKVLRNLPALKDKFDFLDEDKHIGEFISLLEKKLKRSKCIITDYPTVNIKDVFEKYFTNDFPFSKGDKKHEFPDAFALLSIETWCKEHRKKCYVFSSDKDLLNYKSDVLIIVNSYEDFLDEKLRGINEKKKIETIIKLYEKEKHNLESNIRFWIEENLENESTYNLYSYSEIKDIDIRETSSELSDFQIISIDKHEVSLEAKAQISFKVAVEITQDSHYDNVDEEWYSINTITEIIERKMIINIQIIAEIPINGIDYISFEIKSINNDNDISIN